MGGSAGVNAGVRMNLAGLSWLVPVQALLQTHLRLPIQVLICK